MKKRVLFLLLIGGFLFTGVLHAQTDTSRVARNYAIEEVVVTGTRNETDIRHLPMTISVVKRQQLEQNY